MSNIQHRININDGSTHVINFAGGKMYNTKTSGGNHYLMQASTSGRLDINVTDGGLLEFWNELYALTCRDGEGYVDPSLHMTFRDSTFRITNNKSFRFGWDGYNKNAVAPVGVFAATNSVFEGYGFFLGNDVVGTHTAGSYTADFEGCVISARQFRDFHDRPLNAVRVLGIPGINGSYEILAGHFVQGLHPAFFKGRKRLLGFLARFFGLILELVVDIVLNRHSRIHTKDKGPFFCR